MEENIAQKYGNKKRTKNKMSNKKIDIKKEEITRNIAESLFLSKFKKTQQEKIISSLTDAILIKINIALWQKLGEADKSELQRILKSGDEEVLNFINQKIGNFPELVQACAKEVLDDFTLRRKMKPG